jgi:tape measure domain-containing protein
MAAASIVVDLLMKTASFETDTQRAGRALSKLSKDAKSSASAIANEFKRVQEAIQKAGMTANQQKLFDLKQMGATQQQLKAYTRNLDELDKKTKSLTVTNTSFANSFKGLGTIVAAGTAITGFSSIIKISDEYTKFTAQLKLATENAQEFGIAYDNVQRIAEGSQKGIESIAILYSRLDNALSRYGATQKQVSDITEAFALSLRVSGATAEESSSSILQFTQGISRGRLEGEEFNSVVGASPRFLKAMTDATGKNLAELKLMNEQGKLSADIIGNALVKALVDLRKEAEQTKTIEGGFTGIKNQTTLLVGELDKASGASKRLAELLGGVAGIIKDLRTGDAGFLTQLAAGIPGQIIKFTAPRDESAQTSSGTITRNGNAGGDLKPLVKSFDELAKGLTVVSVELDKIKATEAEVRKSFSEKKINPAQYTELMSVLAKQREAFTKTSARSTRALKEENIELKAFAEQQQEIANLLQKATSLESAPKSPAESLQSELDTYTKLNPAIRDYVQGKILAAQANEQFAAMAALLAEANEREIEALIEAQDQQVKFEGDIQSYVDSLQRAIDPTIELADNLGKLQSALSLGIIDQEQYDEMAKFLEDSAKKTEETTDEITEFWKEAAHNMQDAMSDFFFDAMQGNLNDLAGSFKKTIDRMVSDLLASQLSDFLFGGEFGKSGEIGGLAGDLFSGLGSFFGDLLPSFDVGTPYVQQDMVAKIHKGERILTADENRAFRSGSMGGTVVMNIQTPNADSFRKSQPQIMAEMQRSLNRGRRVV